MRNGHDRSAFRRSRGVGTVMVLVLFLAGGFLAGCRGSVRSGTGESSLHEALREQGVRIEPPAPPDRTVPGAADNGIAPPGPVVSAAGSGPDNAAAAPGTPPVASDETVAAAPTDFAAGDNVAAATGDAPPGPTAEAGEAEGTAQAPAAGPQAPKESASAKEDAAKVAKAGAGRRKARDGGAAKAPPPPTDHPLPEPHWARVREELSYRIDFLGITMGYAKFTTMGKAVVDGKEVYHLQVRAWTTNILALIYPVNDTIDYYIDMRTLAPLRQDYTHQNKASQDDIATYDQQTGMITWKYKATGAVRKRQEGPPGVYDPVTLAYAFRALDVTTEEKARNVYAGRKFWKIHARPIGTERLDTGGGVVDTLIVQPVIRREGKLEDKGDLRMWVTNDRRRIPVRFYAKFVKIRTWTLVGELVPNA